MKAAVSIPNEIFERAERYARQIKMVIAQGDVWWTELAEPVGSGPGFRRPL